MNLPLFSLSQKEVEALNESFLWNTLRHKSIHRESGCDKKVWPEPLASCKLLSNTKKVAHLQPALPGRWSHTSLSASGIPVLRSTDLVPLSWLIYYSVSCSWAFSRLVPINKTCLCACSLTSAAPRWAPQTDLWAHADLMKQCRLMARSHWEERAAFQPERLCSLIWKVIGSHCIFSPT